MSHLPIALREILRHPLRTLLVSQGMIWAVAMTVVPAALIGGSQRAAVERASELGTDRMRISVDATSGGSQAAPQEGDLPSLRAMLATGEVAAALRVRHGGIEGVREATWFLGADGDLPAARALTLRAGRFPQASAPGNGAASGPARGTPTTAATPASTAPVEVALEERLARTIAGGAEIGGLLGREYVVVDRERSSWQLRRVDTGATAALPSAGARLRVVGVVSDESARETDALGMQKNKSFAPLAREIMRKMGVYPSGVPYLESGMGIYLPRAELPGTRLHEIFLRGDPLRLADLGERAEAVLVGAGRAPIIYANALAPVLTRPELEGYNALHDIFFWLYIGVGWAVLCNLLLLSGWQRRYEIALRRAEGARRSDIFRQFVGEGLAVGVIGLVTGVLVGMALAWARVSIEPNIALALEVPWSTVLEASAILITGTVLVVSYPAWRASGHAPMTLFRGHV